MTLDTPISKMSRIGAMASGRMKKLGLLTAGDLVFYYPFRYDDFSRILDIQSLRVGETATIRGKIEIIENRRTPYKKKMITEAIISDRTGRMKAVWFNQPFLTKTLKPGGEAFFAGKGEYDYHGLQFTSPSFEKITKKEKETTHTGRLVPVYPTTGRLTQKQIRHLVRQALPLAEGIEDWMPKDILSDLGLESLQKSLRQIHFPDSESLLEAALRRLGFDELFLIQLKSRLLWREAKKGKAPAIEFRPEKIKSFVDSLPFALTNAQRKAAWEIIKDMGSKEPMNRLLDGDVGSGKTVVAAIAALNAHLGGYKTALMAPTGILAKQHYKTFEKLFHDFPVSIALLTSDDFCINQRSEIPCLPAGRKDQNDNSKIKDRERIFSTIKNGDIDIVVGTHALIQEKVGFNKLGLAIVDEQHRFGVGQRSRLIRGPGEQKRTTPHFLSMTATPIPRSLALSLYGDLDLSIIDEIPAGRKKVLSRIVEPKNRQKAYGFVRQKIKEGRQAFVVCPLIDESDKLGCRSAKKEYKRLSEKVFPGLKIGLLHGKMKPEEKEAAMKDFLDKKTDILVSTTVVEVGVDVPNAAIMMIEGAERFGLAQLYQLKGRVGRSDFQSFCLMFSESPGMESRKRLSAIVEAKNGFQLAELDLEMRGPGEAMGTRQSGFLPDLKIASLADYEAVKEARNRAEKLLKKDPELRKHPLLREKIADMDNGGRYPIY